MPPASDASDALNVTNTPKTPPVNVITQAQQLKKKAKLKKHTYKPSDQSLLYRYVNASPELKGKGGVGAQPLLDQLVSDVFMVDDPGPKPKWYVRCEGAAFGCPVTWAAPWALGCILKYAIQCEKLDNIGDGTLQDQVNMILHPKALGERVESNPEHQPLESTPQLPSMEHNDQPTKCSHVNTSMQPWLSSTPLAMVQSVSKPLKQTTMVKFGCKDHIQALKDQLDFNVMVFTCVSGMAPSKVDLPEWKTLWKHGNPEYNPASAAVLTGVHIPNEAACITRLQLEYLQTQDNLTISFDGNSTKCQDSTYMFHVWTPDQCNFLFNADKSSLKSHTGGKIADLLKGVS